MKDESLHDAIKRCRMVAERARSAVNKELNRVVPRVDLQRLETLRKLEAESARSLTVAEIYAGIMEDPDATLLWMAEMVEGENAFGEGRGEDP